MWWTMLFSQTHAWGTGCLSTGSPGWCYCGTKWKKRKWKWLSRVRLFATPWTIQSVEFSRPEYWSGKPFPSPGDFPNPGIKLRDLLHCRWLLFQLSHKGSPIVLEWVQIFPTQESPALQDDSLPSELSGKPISHTQTCTHSFFRFLPHLGRHRALSSVSWAYSGFSSVIYFMQSRVYVSLAQSPGSSHCLFFPW